ncbi:hypothetical protein [Longirhabdus pacifica]|uniref:hypothetical protein n=1 Tax=Longirhabdus pacifica TaxID=2305227 RepID=UPI001008C563|nr:hypothetical protein [Longirhabdus pacifica]
MVDEQQETIYQLWQFYNAIISLEDALSHANPYVQTIVEKEYPLFSEQVKPVKAWIWTCIEQIQQLHYN